MKTLGWIGGSLKGFSLWFECKVVAIMVVKVSDFVNCEDVRFFRLNDFCFKTDSSTSHNFKLSGRIIIT